MTTNNSIRCLEAAIWLAEQKTEKIIITNYYLPAKNYIRSYYPLKKGEAKHRNGTLWVRSDLAYTADRALRVFEFIFSEIAMKDKVLSIIDFMHFCETYFCRYPKDDMSTTRLHYLIAAIRTGDIHVHRGCRKCNQAYVTHKADCIRRVCGACTRNEVIQKNKREIESKRDLVTT